MLWWSAGISPLLSCKPLKGAAKWLPGHQALRLGPRIALLFQLRQAVGALRSEKLSCMADLARKKLSCDAAGWVNRGSHYIVMIIKYERLNL